MKVSNRSDNTPRIFAPSRLALAALAIAILLVIVVRMRLLDIPLERDEGEYAYAGQLLLDGIPPYKLAYNMKLPGTYACYAAIMSVFGQTTAGIHFGFLLVNLATLALLFFVVRRLLDLPHAVLACICYALLSMCPGVVGLAGHATHLVVLAAMGGLLLLLKAREQARGWAFWGSGIMFGLSFVCKQPGLFFGMFGVAVLLRDLTVAPRTKRGVRLRNIGFFCAGLLLPFLLTCLLMAWAGTFDRFWFWTIVYAQTHKGLLTWQEGWRYLVGFNRVAGAMRWSWIAAAAGLVCLFLDKARRESGFVIACLLGFSLAAFTASLYFSPHYFIMMLPVVCILIGIATRRAARAIGEAIPAACFVLACIGFIFANRAIWFEQTPEAACRTIYHLNPFPEAFQIGKWIREHSTPEDTVAVMGSEPEIYFYAHRHSATAYIYMYDLMQSHQYALPMQKEAIQQVETAKPAFLVLVPNKSSWSITTMSDRTILNWLKTYSRNYDLAGTAQILQDRTEYVWGDKVLNENLDTSFDMAVMKRNVGVSAESVEPYRKSAEEGNSDAQIQMGNAFANGSGVERDYVQAVKWFRKAADQGNPNGQTWMGVVYADGLGVEKDYSKALKWYRKATDQGNSYGQTMLGVMYEDGLGVEKDSAEAAKWFRKAAEQGDADGQTWLGMVYANGLGVEKDYIEAAKWLRKAAEQNNIKGQKNLGLLYENGLGVEKNVREAIDWYRKAATGGDADAKASLERLDHNP